MESKAFKEGYHNGLTVAKNADADEIASITDDEVKNAFVDAVGFAGFDGVAVNRETGKPTNPEAWNVAERDFIAGYRKGLSEG